MYDKLVILSPFHIPPKKEGRMKGERSSQTGFQPVFYYRKIIPPSNKLIFTITFCRLKLTTCFCFMDAMFVFITNLSNLSPVFINEKNQLFKIASNQSYIFLVFVLCCLTVFLLYYKIYHF